MKILEIKNNLNYGNDEITSWVNNLIKDKTIPSSLELMSILAKDKISIGFIIKDAYDREILISSFGVGTLGWFTTKRENLLNYMDGGILSCGLYDEDPTTIDLDNFDILITLSAGLFIMNNEENAYIIVSETEIELDIAIEDLDEDIFKEKLEEADKIIIPMLTFND